MDIKERELLPPVYEKKYKIESLKEKIAEKNEEYGAISLQDLDLIRIKLGKNHRKESDWVIIKDILSRHCLFVAEPMNPEPHYPVIEHILSDGRLLYAFTNEEDCKSFITYLNLKDRDFGRAFQIGTISFDEAVDISNRSNLELYIDYSSVSNRKFISYVPDKKLLKAVMIM